MKLTEDQYALKRRILKSILATPNFTPAEAMKSWEVDEPFFSAFILEVQRRRRDIVFFQDGVWKIHNHAVSEWLVRRVMEILLYPNAKKKKRKKRQPKCAYPHCPVPPRHKHHIQYRPPITAPLCFGHHVEITVCNINTVETIRLETGRRRKLRNYERQEIWQDWREGVIEPEFTPDAMLWVGKWKRPRDAWDPRPEEKPTDMAGFPQSAFLTPE